MSRPTASLSTVKGFGLTFNDLTAFANHFLTSPSTPVRDVPSASENRSPAHARTTGSFILPESNPSQERGYRHRYSSSSTSSSGSSRSSYAPLSPTSYSRSSSYAPTSPRAHNSSQFIDHRPRRLTQRERAELAHYTAPEMDIADMVGIYGDTNFEPLR